MVIAKERESRVQVQILDETVCISQGTNILRKDKNLFNQSKQYFMVPSDFSKS